MVVIGWLRHERVQLSTREMGRSQLRVDARAVHSDKRVMDESNMIFDNLLV